MDRDTIKKLLATLQEATRLVESMMDTEFPHGEVPGEPVAQEITFKNKCELYLLKRAKPDSLQRYEGY
ncbi:MAG: hypothetical protein ACOX4Y_07670 [Limnochordia bacterium]